MGVTLKMVDLILMLFSVAWTMNPRVIDMYKSAAFQMMVLSSSPFVKYIILMRKLFCLILNIPKQILVKI